MRGQDDLRGLWMMIIMLEWMLGVLILLIMVSDQN
jgi:hypothetical protein